MSLLVLGLNHRTASLDVREKLTIEREQLSQALGLLGDYAPQGVILSTCNRMEVYTYADDRSAEGMGLPAYVGNFLSAVSGIPGHELREHLYQHHEDECARHLFRVTSGLDSMVVGERQILGQVRTAFSVASDTGSARGPLSGLFHQALRTARQVHRETNIGNHSRSVSQAAVQLARGILGGLSDRRVLVVGAGDAGRLVAQALSDAGARRITVSNRTQWRAEELAKELGGVSAPFDDLALNLAEADVVISSTGSPGFVVNRDMVSTAMHGRNGQPLLLVDIAVPRDIDPSAAGLEGVEVYDIDSLQMLAETSRESIQDALQRSEEIVEERTRQFREWWDSLDVVPLIASIRTQAETIRRQEVAKTLSRTSDQWEGDPEELAAHLDAMTQALVKKLLHQPTRFLKENREAASQKLARQILDFDGGSRRRGPQ